MIYWFAHGLFWILSRVFFPVKVSGLHNLPQEGGFIFASNHESNLDPMIVGLASGRRLTYLAKESLFKNKVFAFFLRQVGAFPINRSTRDIGALKEALKRLSEGRRLVIFPEGTRKVDQKKVQPGIGFLAVKSCVPIIPTLIRGSEKVMPPGKKILTRSHVTVKFGVPKIYPGEATYPEIAQDIMNQVEILSRVP